jgi:hypothetical protein
MNKITSTIIALIVSLLLSPFVFAQEKPASGKPPVDVKEKPAKAQAGARTKADFVGVVAQVDPSGKTVAVKSRGTVVTFDAANPVLKGYRSFEQIKKGDRIAVSYTAGGVRIARTSGTEPAQPQESVRPAQETAKPQKEVTKPPKTSKGRPVRVRERTNSTEFRDVDNNGDGRISPVELGTVVPDLTVEKFKTYDRNGDGSLSNSEYSPLKKTLPNGR